MSTLNTSDIQHTKFAGRLKLDYPAFREELVCALAESLLGHSHGIIHGLEPLEDADRSGSLVATVKIAARIQAAGELVDWLGTAKIALQVSLLVH